MTHSFRAHGSYSDAGAPSACYKQAFRAYACRLAVELPATKLMMRSFCFTCVADGKCFPKHRVHEGGGVLRTAGVIDQLRG